MDYKLDDDTTTTTLTMLRQDFDSYFDNTDIILRSLNLVGTYVLFTVTYANLQLSLLMAT